ncbi:MAG TPA: hypothetical protein VN914_20195, partial [Polyangia bacterium]|nr:hypothetical protein [Polyangia bacterium]
MLWLPLDSRTSLTDHIGRDLPGAALSTDGRLLLRGGRPDDTALELDGLRVRRMSLPLSMLERFDVASAGYGARWADVLGGVVSASTKSGDNRVHTDVGAFNELRDTTTRAVSGTASLPILTDRLFVLAGVRAEGSAGPPQPDPLGLLPTAPGLASFTLGGGLKLTWRPHPRHRFESLT